MIFWILLTAIVVVPLFAALTGHEAVRDYKEKQALAAEKCKIEDALYAKESKKRYEKYLKAYGARYAESQYRVDHMYDGFRSYSYSFDHGPMGAWSRFWAWLIGTVVAFVLYTSIMSIVMVMPQVGSYTGTAFYTSNLVALDTGMQASGRRYLFSGYYGENAAFSFLTKDDDGAIHAGTQWAYRSTVYEGDYEPSVVYYPLVNTIPALLPWSVSYGEATAFYVPVGSVVSDYSVTTPLSGDDE